jgi:2-methylisocitrate lyase-like PEP mutase family enzyme
MPTIQEKASNFAALHRRDHAFIIPNPFDAGSARLLAGSGFEALATTSAGYAFSCGLRDNQVTRPEMMLHLASIVAATDLPVSADLENGYGDAPEDVAETIRLAAGTGIVGCSIEDATGQHESPLYDLELAVDRIAAASDAAPIQRIGAVASIGASRSSPRAAPRAASNPFSTVMLSITGGHMFLLSKASSFISVLDSVSSRCSVCSASVSGARTLS